MNPLGQIIKVREKIIKIACRYSLFYVTIFCKCRSFRLAEIIFNFYTFN